MRRKSLPSVKDAIIALFFPPCTKVAYSINLLHSRVEASVDASLRSDPSYDLLSDVAALPETDAMHLPVFCGSVVLQVSSPQRGPLFSERTWHIEFGRMHVRLAGIGPARL